MLGRIDACARLSLGTMHKILASSCRKDSNLPIIPLTGLTEPSKPISPKAAILLMLGLHFIRLLQKSIDGAIGKS